MNIEFFEEYKKILLDNHYTDADKFKDSKIPDKLYKYFPSYEDRVDSFYNNKLWLAQYDTFNDENEFSFMKIEKNNFENAVLFKKWAYKYNYVDENIFNVSFSQAEEFLERAKRTVSISCFTTSPQNSYFWDEYANKRDGFCIEYSIDRKKLFYPVVYTNEKIDISELLYNIIVDIRDIVAEEQKRYMETGERWNIISDDGMSYLSILYFNYCSKLEKWSKENEFRIIFGNPSEETAPGKLVKYSDLGIKPTKIYIGEKCNVLVKTKLENISKELNYDIVYI